MALEGDDPHADAALAATATPSLSAVSIKLPPFWPADPEVWFTQVEAQFSNKRITAQRTMFDYVISSLSPQFVTEVRDLLLRPPTDEPYNSLKAELVKRTAASVQRKLQQLIRGKNSAIENPHNFSVGCNSYSGTNSGLLPMPTRSSENCFSRGYPPTSGWS